MQFNLWRILGPVPLNPMNNQPIPEGAVIFNAPRPICGTEFNGYNLFTSHHMNNLVWLYYPDQRMQGFTAIVTKDDPYRQEWIKENESLDATVFQFVLEETAKQQLIQFYRDRWPEDRIKQIIESGKFDEHWRESWYNIFALDKVEVE